MTRFHTAVVVAAAAVALAAVGCADHPPPPPEKADRGDRKAGRSQSPPDERAVAHGPAPAPKGQAWAIVGDDDTPKAVNPEVKSGKGKAPAAKVSRAPRQEEPAKPVEPTFTVAGGFDTTKEKAKQSAIRAAVEKLHNYLLEQSPQVHREPTTEMVRRMLVRHPEAKDEDAEYGKVTTEPIPSSDGKPETMYQVEIAVKVQPEHVRELRARERSSEALWVLAGLGGLAAVLAIFFRIDAWTKGYLTSWLVLGTVGAAGLLAGLWWFARH
ncbi:MAG TPA: hypothetical protein VKD90_02890 [Gemmataceae bacterium]|nr:hypothetical protein [Gemmataceae bacterium]